MSILGMNHLFLIYQCLSAIIFNRIREEHFDDSDSCSRKDSITVFQLKNLIRILFRLLNTVPVVLKTFIKKAYTFIFTLLRKV